MKSEEKISDFGKRLLEAFGEEIPKGKIAEIMQVDSQSSVTNYLRGRIPDAEKLQLISDFTKCSIHWLITGEGEKYLSPGKYINLDSTFREIVRDIVNEELDKRSGKTGLNSKSPSFTINLDKQKGEENAA